MVLLVYFLPLNYRNYKIDAGDTLYIVQKTSLQAQFSVHLAAARMPILGTVIGNGFVCFTDSACPCRCPCPSPWPCKSRRRFPTSSRGVFATVSAGCRDGSATPRLIGLQQPRVIRIRGVQLSKNAGIASAAAYPARYMRSSPSNFLVSVDNPYRDSGAMISALPSCSYRLASATSSL